LVQTDVSLNEHQSSLPCATLRRQSEQVPDGNVDRMLADLDVNSCGKLTFISHLPMAD